MSHQLLDIASELGATDASAEVSEQSGLSVSVRMGQLETIERTRDRGAAVTVYKGHRRGHASTSDLSEPALRATVQRALDIAHYTAEDPHSGLPEDADIAREMRDLSLFHPWSITADAAARLALEAEAAALSG